MCFSKDAIYSKFWECKSNGEFTKLNEEPQTEFISSNITTEFQAKIDKNNILIKEIPTGKLLKILGNTWTKLTLENSLIGDAHGLTKKDSSLQE